MLLKEFSAQLDAIFKIRTAEDFDNVGLLCGNLEREVQGVLVCHDALENVVEEAKIKNCNLIVVFHPIIFSGLKSITGKNYVERAVLSAIENKIAIYAIHTAFDNDYFGVNYGICQALGLKNQKILMPKTQDILRLEVYVPTDYVEKVKTALFKAGAGNIGFYDECSFALEGKGTFRPIEGSNPFKGEQNERENSTETQISVVFESYKKYAVLNAMQTSHPYEEVAYQLQKLENENHYLGLGRFGEFETELSEAEFLQKVKEVFGLSVIRHSNFIGKSIKKVGVLGGSGASGIGAAKAVKCDAYLTGDLKYHDFFQAEGKMLLCDIGHFESEQYVSQQIFEIISEKFPKFAILKSSEITNPVNYFL